MYKIDEETMKMETNSIMSNIKEVEELGARIGYGNMMAIASALWRYSLKKSGFPENGALIPHCYSSAETLPKEIIDEIHVYDQWIDKYKNEYK